MRLVCQVRWSWSHGIVTGWLEGRVGLAGRLESQFGKMFDFERKT